MAAVDLSGSIADAGQPATDPTSAGSDPPAHMTVSVVIPAYNVESHIARALDSVLAQTRPPTEIIVVDDGSTDGTAEVIQRYGPAVRYLHSDHVGAAEARNIGIRAAHGDWIAFLDADDEWLPEKLALQTALLARHPDLVWCYGNMFVQRVGQTGRTYSHNPDRIRRALGDAEVFDDYLQALAAGAPTSCITWVVRHDVLDAVGMFCSELPWAQDADLALRLAYRWPRIGYIHRPLAINHFGRAGSITARHWSNLERRCRFLERHAELSRQAGAWDRFRPCVRWLLIQWTRRYLAVEPPVDLSPILRRWGHLLPCRLRLEVRVRGLLGPRLNRAVDAYFRLKNRLRQPFRRPPDTPG